MREDFVHVPKSIPQERIVQQPVAPIADVPVPMTKEMSEEKFIHVPKVVNHRGSIAGAPEEAT